MNNLSAFVLKFKEPLHISDSSAEYTFSERIIHSDTIYAAIMQVIALFGKQPDISDFAISSLFPCFILDEKNKNFEFFFPVLKLPKKIDENTRDIKKLKKIKYLSKELFEKQINGDVELFNSDEILAAKEFGLNKNSNLFHDEKTGKIDEKKASLFYSEEVPRVMVPRQEGNSEPFYFEKLYLNTNYWSLYLLATGNIEKLENYLNILGEFGIGSDKTYGYGRFELIATKIPINFKLPDNNSHFANLSLFIPEDNISYDLDQSFFTITKRGGYITTYPYTTYRKKSVYFFEEGSLIKLNRKPDNFVAGKLVDVTPEIIQNEHTVLRCGKSIFIPVKIK